MKKKYSGETVNRKRRRMLSAGAMFLCMALLFLLSGCGGKENGADGSAANEPGAEEGIYVPEFIPIEGEYVDYEGARVAGNNLCYFSVAWDEEIQYYVQVINILSLQERTVSSFPLAWPEGPRGQAVIEYNFGDDGCLYVIAQTFPEEGEEAELLLCKFQPEGTWDFSQKITGQLRKNPEEGIRVSGMGHEGQAGERSGWTPERAIALAQANPGAELFDGADRSDVMNFLMEYREEAFVDWDTGECGFESEQFKNLLQFVKTFPETVDYEPDRPSTPTRIQGGEVLLKNVELYNFDTIQIDLETFGDDAVCIGYPAADGGRHAMTAIFSYGITSGSKHKEGAWAFMEHILAEEDGSNGMGFPSMKSRLEESMEEAVSVEYLLDEKGEIYLDENGDPVILGNTSSVQYGDGWSYTYHTPTREEAELILSLLGDARPVFEGSGNEIRVIISQEAEAFFAGQKTVEETAGIIQNRVKLYVNENR